MSKNRNDILERKSEILKWISSNESKAYMCKELKCRPVTLDRYLKLMNIEYAGNRGMKGKPSPLRKPAIYYTQTGKFIGSHKLKLRLIEDGVKKYQCEKCKLLEWNGKPIPIELHHVDGNRFNNNLDNLQILCPNCHAQEDNNSGKAVGNYT